MELDVEMIQERQESIKTDAAQLNDHELLVCKSHISHVMVGFGELAWP